MNYYERVQESINYIETMLTEYIDMKEIPKKAFMSSSNFYRLFYAMIGLGVKEYIRRRRINYASYDLRYTQLRVIDIAMKYQFKSQESFTRSFKNIVGTTPGKYRKSEDDYIYERIDLMDKYFEILDKELLEAYPDIKVLKELEPRYVAYFKAVSETPENDASEVIFEWGKRHNLIGERGRSRIFGFNNPNPSEGTKVYGYEFQIDVEEGFVSDDERIKVKHVDGGLYAVTSTRVSEIGTAWGRFLKWLEMSKYKQGSHQWMEEHLTLEGDLKIDIYMPISES